MVRGNEQKPPVLASENLISIEVTTQCNIECRHCFVRSKTAKQVSLSFDILKDILSEAYDTGYRRLHLTGGEPLLFNCLFEVLDYALSLGYISILLNTNGILLSEDTCKVLGHHNGIYISVSVDGPEKLHNRIRGNGTYERVIRGIKNAHHADIDTIIFTTLYKTLVPELGGFSKTVFNSFPKIRHISLIPLMRTMGDDFTLSDDLLDLDDFIRVIQGVFLLNTFGHRIDVLNEPLMYAASMLLDTPLMKWSPSMNREGSIIVMADGSVGLSHFDKTNFGQYEVGKISKVLTSAEFKRAVSADERICPSCKYNSLCKRNGMDRPSNINGQHVPKTLFSKSLLDWIIQRKKT